MSIQTRLLLVYAAIFGIVYILSSLVVYSLPRNQILAQIDGDLYSLASEVLNSETEFNDATGIIEIPLPEDLATLETASTFMMLVNRDGEIVVSSGNLRGFNTLLDPDGLGQEDVYRLVRHEDTQLRVLTAPLFDNQGQLLGYIQVARLLDNFEVFSRVLARALLISLGTAAASLVVVFIMSSRLFRPLEDITTVARQITRADDLTARLQSSFAAWRPLAGLDDDAAAALIHADGVHLLIDLSGHTDHNRLPVFARRPAPVQATWLGYFATTGLAEMDYLLADPIGVPESGQAEFVESIRYLPQTRLCFAAPETEQAVSGLPALAKGVMTLGSFQTLSKINPEVMELWAEVMKRLPGAALRLDGSSGVRAFAGWLVAVKLLALPLLAIGVGSLCGLSGLNFQVVVLFAALPTASSAYILAMRMGGDGRSVAWLISATTLGSMLTLPGWAAWLLH